MSCALNFTEYTDKNETGTITADRKYSAAAHNLLEKSYKGGKAPKEL